MRAQSTIPSAHVGKGNNKTKINSGFLTTPFRLKEGLEEASKEYGIKYNIICEM